MAGEGEWYQQPDGSRDRWEMKCPPLFGGTITYGWYGEATGYEARLNGERLGAYHELAHAKARIDWEIWNRIRQTIPGYKVLLARRETWEYGGGAFKKPQEKARPNTM